MIGLYITVVIVIGVVCAIGLPCYFNYKPKQLDYQKECEKQNAEISIKALQLEIEKENTKQIELNSHAFERKESALEEEARRIKAQEETKQLQIKADFREKYNERLY